MVMQEMRRSVKRYLTNAARPRAAMERGSQMRVAPRTRLTATSPAAGPDSKWRVSLVKSYDFLRETAGRVWMSLFGGVG